MQGRIRELAQNLALMIGSLVVVLLALEFVVFRYVLVPDDLLENVTIDGVVRYKPSSQATFRYPDGHETRVTINGQGWNSTRAGYRRPRVPGRLRVAVIGDSYVHARFVDPSQGFPEIVERRLAVAGLDVEVFRFGMDGAPLSQYLNVLRREVLAYKPDVVLVQLVHNDFDESYRALSHRTASAFLKLTTDSAGRIVEVPPVDFAPGFADALRRSSTFRYLYYQTGLQLTLRDLIQRHYWGGGDEWQPAFISGGVDIRTINDHPRNAFYARYVVAKMKALAEREGFQLAFAMDAVREAIYEGRKPMDYEIGRLNTIARRLTAEMGLPFLDLQETFASDYARHRQRFEFPFDWHWNARGNRVAGEAIARFLLSHPALNLKAVAVTGSTRRMPTTNPRVDGPRIDGPDFDRPGVDRITPIDGPGRQRAIDA